MLRILIMVGIGAGLGSALGYFGQCTSGTCPLTSTWWRGAIYGGAMGLLFGITTLRGGGGSAMNQSTANVKHVAESDFDAVVNASEQPVVVDFYATWCGPCKALAPVLENLAGQFQGQVVFLKVNVEEAPNLARKFAISGVPTLLFFKEAKVADRVVGLAREQDLQTRLRSLARTKETALVK